MQVLQLVLLDELCLELLHHLHLVLVQILEAELQRTVRLLEVEHRAWLRVAAIVHRHHAHAWHREVLLRVVVLLPRLAALACELVGEILVIALHLVHLSHVVRLLLSAYLFLHFLELLKLLKLLELHELFVLIGWHERIWKLGLRAWRDPALAIHSIEGSLLLSTQVLLGLVIGLLWRLLLALFDVCLLR
jgi:hypothetical protein